MLFVCTYRYEHIYSEKDIILIHLNWSFCGSPYVLGVKSCGYSNVPDLTLFWASGTDMGLKSAQRAEWG